MTAWTTLRSNKGFDTSHVGKNVSWTMNAKTIKNCTCKEKLDNEIIERLCIVSYLLIYNKQS